MVTGQSGVHALRSLIIGVINKRGSPISIPSMISIGNSMICSDTWHKYHEGYFEIVIHIS